MVDHGVLRPAGLDSFDSNSHYADVGQTIEALEPTHSGTRPFWPGRNLTSARSGWRKQYCKDVIAEFDDSWGPCNRKIIFASKARLPGDAGKRLYKGMS